MRKLALLASCFVLAAGVLLAEKSHAPKIDPLRISATVKYLSSDLLEGRGTGQKGGDAAADWIADQFKSYGLKPAGANGTFFQDVPMVGLRTLPSTTFSFVPASGAPVELKNLDDFVTTNETQTESADIDAPIVFVGYGITSPENKWDDYKGYDLHGKVALLFVSEPESNDPNFFKGKALTYSGRWTYKYEETARRGAIGTIIIHRTDLASYPWEVVRNSWGGERSYLKLDGTPKLQAASWIPLEVARKLVAMGGLNLDTLYKESQSRDFKPIELPVHLKAHIASAVRPFSSRNVVAMVPGDYGGRQASRRFSTPRTTITSALIPPVRKAIRSITAPWTTRPAAASCSNSLASGPPPSPLHRARFSSPPSLPKSKASSAPNIWAAISNNFPPSRSSI